MKLALMAAALLCAGRTFAAEGVTIHVLGLFHPKTLILVAEPANPISAAIPRQKITIGDSLCDSATMTFHVGEVSLTCGHVRMIAPRIVFASESQSAPFVLVVPGKLRRRYQGSLSIAAKDNELFAVVEMDLETAVASIVAAEVPASTPFEALKAQAVVTRSFLVASHSRHRDSEFCDTTHCQFLRSPPPADSAASRATRSTKGLVLAWHGKPFPAMYSAACGGRTRTLPQHAQLPAAYPYYAVECRYCLRHPDQNGTVGHGIGLCQRGSAGMAASTFQEILIHYFPNTELMKFF